MKEFTNAGGEVGFGDAAEGTKVLKIFFPGEAVEDREAVGKQPHGGFGGDGVMPHVKTTDYCLPASGRRSPVAMLSMVVLPAPLGPTMPKMLPRGTVS